MYGRSVCERLGVSIGVLVVLCMVEQVWEVGLVWQVFCICKMFVKSVRSWVIQ